MHEPYRRFAIGQFSCTAIADTDQGARNVLLVEGDQKRILIDTGMGLSDPKNPGLLFERLQELRIDAELIDTVILSHADFDHIGGAVSENGATFSGADHFLRRAEVEFWRHRPSRLPASPLYDDDFRGRVNSVPPAAIEALSGNLRLVEGDINEVVAGITVIAAPGHTPGNSIVRIESDGQELMCIADLLYQPENVEVEAWVSPYDYDADTVVQTRRKVLSDAASRETLLMAYHLPFPGLGRVESRGNAWKWFDAS
jgi:glyoxylase-like metal-dependent hydrolase (beta-lactamase superfamily II)